MQALGKSTLIVDAVMTWQSCCHLLATVVNLLPRPRKLRFHIYESKMATVWDEAASQR